MKKITKIICIILQIILFQIQALYWCETEEKQIQCFDLKEIEDQQIECQQTTFNYQNETLYFENGKSTSSRVFKELFYGHTVLRPSCYECPYKSVMHPGDITIADYWGIGVEVPFKKNVAAGVSLVIDNQGMMSTLIGDLKEYAYIEKRPLEECKAKNHNLNTPSERPDARNEAVKDMLDVNVTLRNYAEKYHLMKKENLQYYLLKWTKKLVYTLGFYNVYKTISYKLGRNS